MVMFQKIYCRGFFNVLSIQYNQLIKNLSKSGLVVIDSIKFCLLNLIKLYKTRITWYNFIKESMTQKIKVKKLENSPYVIAPQQVIGKGSFSVIVRAYNLQNPKEQLVSKIISVKDAQTSITIKAELQILKKLPYHPNLVNCMKFQISSENNFYLIMQYCNEGNLDKYLVRKKFNIPQEKIWFFLKQFCQGYKVLYNNGIVHRDIKPENILIHNGDFKLADFGLSKKVEDMEIIGNMSAKGTPLYMAPQIHIEKQGSSKVDVFSLGVVIYKMAFNGQYPFFDQSRKYRSVNEYFKQLLLRKLIIPKNNRSETLVNLIEKMLTKDKQKRISWKQIFEMDEIKNAIRYERKKQLAPMDQLSRSLMIVNKSQTQVHIVHNPHNEKSSQENQESTSIILQQTFNKKNKSTFQKTLFKNKLLYTLIEYTNKKIEKYIKRTSQLHQKQWQKQYGQHAKNIKENKEPFSRKDFALFKHICKHLNKLVEDGILYSLYVIAKLEQISGDWTQLNSGEIMNFQDIFQNDKGIFLDQYKGLITAKHQAKQPQSTENIAQKEVFQMPSYTSSISDKYQDSLYSILNQYFEYPSSTRTQLRPIFALLMHIYDLAIKSQISHHRMDQIFKDNDSPDKQAQNSSKDKNLVEKAQQETTIQFYQYLMDIETVQQSTLKEQMQKKGLVFL